MKQYLSMLLFDRKNLRFTDFVRLQQLEAQLGALAFDGVGDERHRLELMRQYNVPPLGFQRVPPTAFPPPGTRARAPRTDCGGSGRERTPLTISCLACLCPPLLEGKTARVPASRSGKTCVLLL